MSNWARVQLDGLNELIGLLSNAPREIHDEGMAIVREATEFAADEIRHAYPERTYGRTAGRGTLRRLVRTNFPSSTILVGIAQSAAPHSHLYEFGTKDRYTGARTWVTRKGERRSKSTGTRWHFRGKGPKHPVTVPIAQRRRKHMIVQLANMVRSKGFEVTGV